jgi:hypothetical protein
MTKKSKSSAMASSGKKKSVRNEIIRMPRTVTQSGKIIEVRDFRDQAQYALGSLGASIGYSFFAQLSNSSELADYQALYDEYRIIRVKYQFFPVCNMYAANATAAFSGTTYFAIDLDDVTVPTNAAYLLNYVNMQARSFYEYFEITFKPKIAVAANVGSLTFSGSIPTENAWITTAAPSVQNYGLKIFLNNTGSIAAANPIYNLLATTTVEFRRAI